MDEDGREPPILRILRIQPIKSCLLLLLASTLASCSSGGEGAGEPTGPGSSPPDPVAAVEIDAGTGTLTIGGTSQLRAIVRDSSGNTLSNRSVAWRSSNVAVATVDAAGVVRGVSSGSATITATSEGVSGIATITVVSPLPVAPPPIGAVSFSTAPSGTGSLQAPFETGGEQYLLIFQSATDVPGIFDLSVSTTTPISLTKVGGPSLRLAAARRTYQLEREIHREGYEALQQHGVATRTPLLVQPGLILGQERTFFVLNPKESRFEQRRSLLGYIGSHSLVYVDAAAPPEVLSAADVQQIGQRFDASIYTTIRGAYGSESDIDGNGRPIILLTPVVNQQVEGDVRLFGFFSPNDLADTPVSNRAEIFYVIVPDPQGTFAEPTDPIEGLQDDILATTGHEFVHMISANERVLQRGLPMQDVWLEEGLAHYGEFIINLPILAESNIAIYLIVGSTFGSVTGILDTVLDRGAATLFVARTIAKVGRRRLLDLVAAPETGIRSVESGTGQPFSLLFHEWAASVYNDVYPVRGLSLTFPGLNLRQIVTRALGQSPPPDANILGRFAGTVQTSASGSIEMFNGSVAYFLLDSSKSLVVAEVGFQAPQSSGLQVALIRVR